MIFAFGATGAGKTHTLLGSHQMETEICDSELSDKGTTEIRKRCKSPASKLQIPERAPSSPSFHNTRCGVTQASLSSPNCSQVFESQLRCSQYKAGEPTEELGLLFQSVQHAFLLATEIPDRCVEVAISVAEVYQERVADLLAGSTIVPVRQHPQRGFYANGLKRRVCNTFVDAQRVLQAALSHRCVFMSRKAAPNLL